MLRRCLLALGFLPLPVATIFVHCSEQTEQVSELRTWMCLICGWIYDEAAGDPEHDIAPGTRWADIPMNWTCPECGARKEDFEMVEI
jgi:rubredoxin